MFRLVLCFTIFSFAALRGTEDNAQKLIQLYAGEAISKALISAVKANFTTYLNEPKTAEELSEKTGFEVEKTKVILKLLSSQGVFTELCESYYVNNETSRLLTKKEPTTLYNVLSNQNAVKAIKEKIKISTLDLIAVYPYDHRPLINLSKKDYFINELEKSILGYPKKPLSKKVYYLNSCNIKEEELSSTLKQIYGQLQIGENLVLLANVSILDGRSIYTLAKRYQELEVFEKGDPDLNFYQTVLNEAGFTLKHCYTSLTEITLLDALKEI